MIDVMTKKALTDLMKNYGKQFKTMTLTQLQITSTNLQIKEVTLERMI